MIRKFFFVVLSVLIPSIVFGFGSSCGSCDIAPVSKVESVQRLERQLDQALTDDIRRLQLVGELCSADVGFDCGELTDQEAGAVVSEYRLQAAQWQDRK